MTLTRLSTEELAAYKAAYWREFWPQYSARRRRHREDESARYRGQVLRLMRDGLRPCAAVRETGYERHHLTYWRKRVPGFDRALATARTDAIARKLEAIVSRVEAGATITQALAAEERSAWWLYQHLPRFPHQRRRLYAGRPSKTEADVAERAERLIANLDAGMGFGEACRSARMSRTRWATWEHTRPELYAAIVEARERNDIGRHSVGRRAWKTRRERAA